MKLERTRHPGVYKRGSSSYCAIVSWKDGAGRRRQKWLTRRTLKEALAAKRDAESELARGVRPDGGRLTVKQFMETMWLPEIETELRPLTIKKYRQIVNGHIIPSIGGVKLADLDRDTLRDFYRSRPSPQLGRYCASVLSSAMSYAVRERGLLAANPCAAVSRPKAKPKETPHLDRDEARQLLKAVEGTALEGAIVLGLVGGLRIAEVVSVRWKDIDLETGNVNVGGSYWGSTKSGKPRAFRLPASAVASLRRYKREQAERLLRIGIRQDETTYVTTHPLGHQWHPNRLGAAFRAFCEEHRFTISFHGLRHTSAIAQLSAGIDVGTVAGRLGHSPSVLLKTYSHFVKTADELAAQRLEMYLG